MELDGVLNSVRRSNRTKISVGFFIAGLGVFMIALGIISKEAYGDMNEAGIVFAWIFALLFLATGFLMIYLSVKSNQSIGNRSHPLLKSMDYPLDIDVVWAYEHIIKSSATANHSVHIYFSNGKMEGIAPKKKDVQPFIQFLQSKFANARFGFSEETQKEFAMQKKRYKKKEIDRIAL